VSVVVSDLERDTLARMDADEAAGRSVFSARPDLGYFRNRERLHWTGPIRFEPRLGPWLYRKLAGPVGIYHYSADPEYPMTLVLSDGTEIQPDRTFESDMGSVPPLIQAIPGGWFGKDRLLPAYTGHDSDYTFGVHWIRRPGGEAVFRPEPVDKGRADLKLRLGALILGCPRWPADRIYWAVDRFGTGVWSRRGGARVAWKARKQAEGVLV